MGLPAGGRKSKDVAPSVSTEFLSWLNAALVVVQCTERCSAPVVQCMERGAGQAGTPPVASRWFVFADPRGFGIAADGRYRYELPGFTSGTAQVS